METLFQIRIACFGFGTSCRFAGLPEVQTACSHVTSQSEDSDVETSTTPATNDEKPFAAAAHVHGESKQLLARREPLVALLLIGVVSRTVHVPTDPRLARSVSLRVSDSLLCCDGNHSLTLGAGLWITAAVGVVTHCFLRHVVTAASYKVHSDCVHLLIISSFAPVHQPIDSYCLDGTESGGKAADWSRVTVRVAHAPLPSTLSDWLGPPQSGRPTIELVSGWTVLRAAGWMNEWM